MKKTVIIIAAIVVLVLIVVGSYNKLITIDENVNKAWSEVQTQYQRRADVFISQLEVVKGAASNEKEILIGITKARSGITDAKDNMANAETPAELDKYMAQAQQSALSIKVQVEAYPQIRSTDAFLKFQDEVSGTENRIATARSDYNTAVTTYNKKVRSIPTMLYANMLGFGVKEQFEADAGTDKRPEIKF